MLQRATGGQNGSLCTCRSWTGVRPTCRSQDVRPSRGPRPSRRALRCDVSRQILAEFRLTIPVVFSSADVQHWLGYTAPSFPGSSFIPPLIFGYGDVVFLRGAAGELTDRTPGMMTLVSLAILVPFATSLAATFGIFEIDVWWVERRIALRRRPRRPRPTSQRRGANPCLDRRDLIFERGPPRKLWFWEMSAGNDSRPA